MKMLLTAAALMLALAPLACTRIEAPPEGAVQSNAIESNDGGQDAHHDHAGYAATVLRDDQRWATDEPLRIAMLRIRTAVEQAATAHARQELRPADAQALASSVEEGVAYMVANCKLEPAADAALHVLIGRMMSAAASVKSDPASDSGLPELLAVLDDYQAAFDHPGWRPVQAR